MFADGAMMCFPRTQAFGWMKTSGGMEAAAETPRLPWMAAFVLKSVYSHRGMCRR